MRMKDWLTEEEQELVTEETFWKWYEVAYDRMTFRKFLKGFLIGCSIALVTVGILFALGLIG